MLIATEAESNDIYGEFFAEPSYWAGQSPVAMSMVEKHDGSSLHVISADFTGKTITVHDAGSDGILTSRSKFLTKGRPCSVTAGDFNHDIIMDIAVLNFDENSISIYYGDYEGHYREFSSYKIGDKPLSVVAEDLDGKRYKDDLVVLSSGDKSVYVHYYSGITKKIVVGKIPSSLKVYDINADGLKDIIVTNAGEDTVSVITQNINGEFAVSDIIKTGSIPSDASVGFLIANRSFVMAVASMYGGIVDIFGKSSSGIFQKTQTLDSELSHPSKVVVEDFNRDGIPDLAIADIGSSPRSLHGNRILIYKGDKYGFFSYKYSLTAGITPLALLTEDVTGDGLPDLVALNEGSQNLVVYKGNGDCTFGYANNYPAGDGPHWVDTSDFDLDGNLDLVTANIDSTDISVLIGKGDGSFLPPSKYDIHSMVHAVTVGDINNDGIPDLVTANLGSNTITLLFGDGKGMFITSKEYIVGPKPHLVRIVDINGDSIPDLVIPIYGSNYTRILFGTGDGSFVNGAVLTSGVQPNDAAIADLNYDGIADIAVSHFYENYITVFFGTAGGAFLQGKNIFVGKSQHSILLKDINYDGKADIIGSTFSNNSVFTLFGTGNGSFYGLTEYQTGKLTSTIALEDFNGDGIADLAVVCELDNIITIFTGKPDGSFVYPVEFIAGSRPVALITGDFNKDDKLDIISANWYSNDINVLLRR